ncbi:MAG TPA: SIMPL domain-containing protein, partial [Actinomycetota bacterium]|nr:SIMPL domain-containing protein [Actinomycetota bacterium]
MRKGFRASSSVTVRIDDVAIIGKLMSEATGRARAEVRGPWWGVKPDNAARAEACRLAATDARRKAEAYAAALGKRLGDVLEVVGTVRSSRV